MGGIAIVVAFLGGISLIQLVGNISPIQIRYFWGLLASLFVMVAVSLYDTFRPLTAGTKLAGQAVAVFIAMVSGIVLTEFHIPWIGWIDGGWWGYP